MGSALFDDRDNRQFDRKQLVYYLKVLYHDTGRIAGYLGDISAQGLMIFAKETIPAHQICRFRINKDDDLALSNHLVFDAKRLWIEKDANPEFYTIGFEFVDLDTQQLDLVKDLIKYHGFDS
jgi:hypothetical protein